MKIIFSKEVKHALNNNLPIVALESTIITHGMPYPTNIETAKKVEQEIRNNGVTPATIAFINGEFHVGLEEDELNILGNDNKLVKISRRDIPVIVAKKLSGGTTVAATMIIANMVGIKIFVTGGIGGVHKEGNNTFDISADLDELGRTNVLVICAGPKAILDIDLTLEYLETKGVPVLGYQVDNMPLFYTRESKYKVDYRIDTPSEMASVMHEKWNNNINGGILLTNPIPKEYSISSNEIDKYIESANNEAKDKEIKGKNLTPFLLEKISLLTQNKSLESNIALVLNNARVGALIAKEFYK